MTFTVLAMHIAAFTCCKKNRQNGITLRSNEEDHKPNFVVLIIGTSCMSRDIPTTFFTHMDICAVSY
ncbi:hypothetical protein [Pseudomonas abietaniphila]|uniref:hypothetical protein n=1 Tax=Pseudomonas abietaniphila TaxID=89065 RepID=UPI000942CA92|nr:hypothetical protein [Pseudomonas abietaniphila]